MACSRIPPLKQYLASLLRLRTVWDWLLLASILFPALMLLSIVIKNPHSGLQRVSLQLPAVGLPLIGLIIIKFFYQFFFFNATGEEVGWRGFVLPRLQVRLCPLLACLLINLFWPLWHLFLWMAEGKPVSSLEYWAETYLTHLSATIIIVWFYNCSEGSILVAGVTHAAANTAFALFSNLDITTYSIIAGAVALGFILLNRMWKKLPPDHPAVYQPPTQTG